MLEHPYIEVKIIQSKDPKMEILKVLENKSLKNHHAHPTWKEEGDEKILRVDYDSIDLFVKGYTRDKLIYENFIKYINLQEIHFGNNKSQTDEDNEEIYLMLKYRTNYKDPIRNNYSFTFKIIELIGIGASYEEVYDGFILFYKTKEDFLIGQMDLLNLKEVKAFLSSKNLLKPSIEVFFNQLENHNFKDPNTFGI